MKGDEGFCLLKYRKGKGNLSIQSVKRPYRAKRWHFMAVKKAGKRSSFVINSYFKDSAFTAVKREEKF